MRTVMSIFNNAYVFKDGRYLTQNSLYRHNCEAKNLLGKHVDLRIFFVPNMEGAKSDIFKAYLSEKANAIAEKGKTPIFVLTTDTPSIRKMLANTSFIVRDKTVVDVHKTLWLLRELKAMLNGHIFVYDIAHSKAFLEYRKSVLTQRKEERKNQEGKFNQNIRFYIDAYAKETYNSILGRKVDVSEVSNLLSIVDKYTNRIKREVVPVYWGVLDDPYLDIWQKLIVSKQVFIIVAVAKTNVKYLERAELPKNWMRVNSEFILNSREFRRWITCNDKRVFANENCLEIYRNTSDKYMFPDIEKVRQYSCSNLNNVSNLTTLEQLKTQFKGYYDQTMLEGYELFKKYNDIASKMKGILMLNDEELTPLSMYAAMKLKIVRPKWETYQRIARAFNSKTKETNEENS
jgi:hypothetical protein